jgi:putative adenylate-forming enzyme
MLATFLTAYVRGKMMPQILSSRKCIEAWQQRSINRHLAWVVKNSNFYRNFYDGYNLSDWRQLPIIDKSVMMANFDKINTVGISQASASKVAIHSELQRDFSPMINQIAVGLSSGTSGARGLFLTSPRERAIWAGAMLAKTLPLGLSRHRIALFLRANNYLYQSIKNQLIQFSYFDLMQDMGSHINRLNCFQPSILVAPPAVLKILSSYQLSGVLKIVPKKIYSVADVLDSLTAKAISAGFCQIIHQLYQCTEGFIAATCAHGNMHVNEDLLLIQKELIVGQKDRFHPIITDFTRTSQPIVRYRLNDILIERPEPCPCGSAFLSIASIEGREDDILLFWNSNKDKIKMVFPDFIRNTLIDSSEDIEEYQVLQNCVDEVEVWLKCDENCRYKTEKAVFERFIILFKKLDILLPSIQFRPLKINDLMQKKRRVKRTFSIPKNIEQSASYAKTS